MNLNVDSFWKPKDVDLSYLVSIKGGKGWSEKEGVKKLSTFWSHAKLPLRHDDLSVTIVYWLYTSINFISWWGKRQKTDIVLHIPINFCELLHNHKFHMRQY